MCLRRGRVAELVDALDLGSSGETLGGSSPPSPTIDQLCSELVRSDPICSELIRIAKELVANQVDIPPEAAAILWDNLWDLL